MKQKEEPYSAVGVIYFARPFITVINHWAMDPRQPCGGGGSGRKIARERWENDDLGN